LAPIAAINSFDWLSNMSLPNGEAPLIVLKYALKTDEKSFTAILKTYFVYGDIVATVASPGHDIGIVTLTGELVHPNEEKKELTLREVAKIYRKASQKDIDIWSAAEKEEPMKVRARELAIAHKLEMKISDIEFQMDQSNVLLHGK
jgi:cell fate regulator YaaT (PSP1 superfamily)